MVKGVDFIMKMLLISDNHGRWKQVYNIVKKSRPNVDYIFHLGDSEFEYDDPIWKMVDGVVKGNMDHNHHYSKELVFDTPEGKVVLVHGHDHGVNRSNSAILNLAKERDAKFLFHGHTHQLKSELVDGILIVNPGSLNRSRGIYPERTYAIVTVDKDTSKVEFYNEDMELIPDLTHTYPRN